MKKSIYLSSLGHQFCRVGILQRNNNLNELTLDLGKLVNLTKEDFMKARSVGRVTAERLDSVREQLVELLVSKN